MARVAEVTSARKVRSAISFRVALACVASIIAISTLYFYSKGDRSGPKELRSAHQVLAVLALSPGEFKGDGSTTPSVAPPLGGKVVLKLEIPGQDRGTTFAVEVSRLTAEGDWQTVFPAVTATASAGPDRKAVLEVPLDSSSLSRGEYRVSVRGGQPRLNEHYRFRAAP
jgi:hypothetical protein